MNLKDKIIKAIDEHLWMADPYVYSLTRVKSAFGIGTMTLDDFVEWDENDVADLADSIAKELQPQLTQEQEVVLRWLKEHYYSTSHTMYALLRKFKRVNLVEENITNTLDSLSSLQQAQVLKAFAEWVLEQKEE